MGTNTKKKANSQNTDYEEKSYKDWLFPKSEGAKKHLEKVKEALNLSGIPLELRTRKIFSETEYVASDFYYTSEPLDTFSQESRTAVWRQLDIVAEKILDTILINGFEVVFRIAFLGDCKYRSSKDVFVFETSKYVYFPYDIPIVLSGKNVIGNYLTAGCELPLTVDKLTMADVSTLTKKDNNFNDREIFDACNQILSAIESYSIENKERRRLLYNSITKSLGITERWLSFLDEKKKSGTQTHDEYPWGSIIKEEIKEEFSKKCEVTLPENIVHPFIEVKILVPIFILDEKRGIIQVIPDKSGQVIADGFEDKGYCVYVHMHNKVLAGTKEGNRLPIIITNLSNLQNCIQLVERGFLRRIDNAKQRLEKNPDIIIKELLFSDT